MVFSVLSFVPSVAAHAASSGWLALVTLAAFSALAVFGEVIAPDGGGAPAGDGGSPAGDVVGDTAADRGTDPDPAAGGDRRAGAEPDEELDDDEVGLPPEVLNDPKRLRTRHRRLQRQTSAMRPIAERFRKPDGTFMSAPEIDRMRARAADMDEIQEVLDSNPDILQTLVDRKRGRQPAAPVDDYQDPYTPEELERAGVDTDSPAGQFLLAQLRKLDRANHELRRDAKRLEQGIGSVHERDMQRTLQQTENTWKNETLAAARTAGLTGDDLEDYVNSVYKDFRLARAEKRLDKADRAAIIARALRPFKRTRVADDRRSAAAAHQRADANGARPQPGNRAAASPARPQDTNRVGTIKDGRKSFFERAGMAPPPGVR